MSVKLETQLHCKELLQPALDKFSEYLAKEQKARAEMSKLLNDMTVSTSSKEVPAARKFEISKQILKNFGKIREECAILAHEFKRKLDREFTLMIGDIDFSISHH